MNRGDFIEDIEMTYTELRDEHYSSLQERKYLSLNRARQKKLDIDWVVSPPARAPKFLGVKVFKDYPLEKLVPMIDWNPFFQVWQLRGKYPNRNYPKIFNDPTVGEEARKVFMEAQAMLQNIIDQKLLRANGIIGLFPAHGKNEDIFIYKDESRDQVIATLYGLRQQAEKETDQPYIAIGDFVAPEESGHRDYVGMFAVSSGIGIEEIVRKYEADQDDYNAIMAKSLADRLAEAFAECLHADVRRTYWGYSENEELSSSDLIKVKYQGIRPAPGYPSQPDHTEKETMWSLMNVEELVDIKLTSSLAMYPAASVCGLYFAHPDAPYFAVGKITKDQVQDYALRKGMPVQQVEMWLSSILAYEDNV
eukprot:TRINITY_DN1687_c0_g1_i1.p1 TRINITY_DN1687_c0_g1~~TRINITY_DN1687_c0_g1_i1.p1  ORF type:complete len:427 (+),score=100.15 TRINITY_DN1687_c0_g1_i1:191-1282(+)